MAINRDIKYLNRDFSTLRDQLITYAKTYFPNTYNDFSPSSPGMMFMEMAAYVGDVLSFYLDNQVQETYIQYARQTNNIFDLAYMLGYKPKVTSAATVTLDFYQTVPSTTSGSNNITIPDFNYSLLIPTNTTVTSNTDSNLTFIIRDKVDFSFSSSLDPTEVIVYQTSGGSPTSYLLKKSRQAVSSTIKTTTSTFTVPVPFNYIDINDNNIIGILDVFDSNGNQWYEVDNLAQDAIFDTITNTAPNDPNFSSFTDTPNLLRIKQVQNRFASRFLDAENLRILFGAGNPNDTTEVIIPNPQNVGLGLPYQQDKLTTAYSPTNFVFTNTFGVSPSNTTLTIRYLVGGGVASNAPVGTLTSVNTSGVQFINSNISSTQTAQDTFDSLRVNNAAAASGGSSGDSLEEIRQNSLANFQTQLRVVTADDYNVRVLSLPPQYGSISKVYTIQEKATNTTIGTPPSAVDVYILGSNNDGSLKIASPALKQNIITYLQPFRIINDSVKIKDAFIINIGVEFDIIVLPNYNNDQVLTNCINYLIDYFNIDNWQINQPIILKQLFVGLDQIDGVQTVQNINITNKTNTVEGYSEYAYDIQSATYNNIIYPSIDPMIFEVKYPTVDIKGRVVTL
jgi:hypothetical protein